MASVSITGAFRFMVSRGFPAMPKRPTAQRASIAHHIGEAAAMVAALAWLALILLPPVLALWR